MNRFTLAFATITLLALAGCGGGEPTAAPFAGTKTTSTLDAAAQVECVNIERAYNAWNTLRRPHTAADVAALNKFTVKRVMEDGKSFLDAVTGYPDQASKVLASAIAEYNVELAMVNVQATMNGEIGDEQARKTGTAASEVEGAYQAWKSSTCS